MTQYGVVDVTKWEYTRPELEGANVNEWLRAPDTDDEWLFKRVVQSRSGSDWAEKVAAEVARLLDVPAARVELAARSGLPGVISRDARPDPTWE